jgi:3D (Asp-Asp-Asp) domain-containing protein
MGKIFSIILIFSVGINLFSPQVVKIGIENESSSFAVVRNNIVEDGVYFIDNNTFIALNPPSLPSSTTSLENTVPQEQPLQTERVTLTAYSSTYFECDGNPFRTALGTSVRDGVVATNFLPFGTEIKIPEVFGDKIFVVEDRMAKKYWKNVDIWMPTYQSALNFGKKYATIEILSK